MEETLNAEAWRSLLAQQPITIKTYDFGLDQQSLQYGLSAAYAQQVHSRGRQVDDNDNLRALITQVATIMKHPAGKFGIMLASTCGTGKTTMAHAFQRICNIQLPKISDRCTGARMINAKDIVKAYNDNYRYFQRIIDEPVLIIDDLGDEATESVQYGNITTPLVDLIEHRYDERLYTLVTTNLTAEQIETKYGKRIRDRMREMFHKIVLPEGSYR